MQDHVKNGVANMQVIIAAGEFDLHHLQGEQGQQIQTDLHFYFLFYLFL